MGSVCVDLLNVNANRSARIDWRNRGHGTHTRMCNRDARRAGPRCVRASACIAQHRASHQFGVGGRERRSQRNSTREESDASML
jgi:hypothetical protein